ncbi:hypothetical protein [Diaphorobacter sp. J5-51]|uniref:hypothetical protein n=1 Tax=Diaphorobacter sp. J5-51 TaxID=680496 RepID=UPI000643241D|nr:hypothetical protein [Diaphorobacter sp. J5-51]KLR57294.1 hypothetical protein OX89_13160 [Diaphorobacter sp. J5-51]
MSTTLYYETRAGVRRYTGSITDDGWLEDGTPIEDMAPYFITDAALDGEQAKAVMARVLQLCEVGATVDVQAIVQQVLDGALVPLSHYDHMLIGFDGARHPRTKYDYLIDLMGEFQCFHSMDGRRCMFESYGATVDFKALQCFVDAFGQQRTEQAIELLRDCEFTPLASLVATYLSVCLKGLAKEIIAAGEKTNEPALAA